MEVVGEDGPGRSLGARERVRVGRFERFGVVVHHEIDVAPLAVEDEPQGVAVVKEALGSGHQAGMLEPGEGEVLTVMAKAGAVLAVDAAPQIGGGAVDLVANAVISSESTRWVTP